MICPGSASYLTDQGISEVILSASLMPKKGAILDGEAFVPFVTPEPEVPGLDRIVNQNVSRAAAAQSRSEEMRLQAERQSA